MSYSEFIEKQYFEELDGLIGKENIKLFDEENKMVLLYMFPLIERLIIEILDISTIVNVESKEQGTIKTINSLLQQDIVKKILGDNLFEKISKYFNENGIRNKMMHFDPDNNKVFCNSDNVQEVKKIAIDLTELYTKKISESKSPIKEIDEIDI